MKTNWRDRLFAWKENLRISWVVISYALLNIFVIGFSLIIALFIRVIYLILPVAIVIMLVVLVLFWTKIIPGV